MKLHLKVLQKKLIIILTNTSVEALISVSFFLLRYLTFLEVNIILFHGLSHLKELVMKYCLLQPNDWFILALFYIGQQYCMCILWILALLYVTCAHKCLNCEHLFRYMKSQRCLIKKSSIFSSVPYKLFNILELILVFVYIV